MMYSYKCECDIIGALSSGARKGDQKDSAPTSRDPKSNHDQNLVPKNKKPTNKSSLGTMCTLGKDSYYLHQIYNFSSLYGCMLILHV